MQLPQDWGRRTPPNVDEEMLAKGEASDILHSRGQKRSEREDHLWAKALTAKRRSRASQLKHLGVCADALVAKRTMTGRLHEDANFLKTCGSRC